MSNYKSSFKKDLKAELQSTRESMKDFFNPDNSGLKRLSSFEVNGTFNTQTDVNRALKIVKDTEQSPELRAAAIMGLTGEAGKNEELLDYLIETVANHEAPVQVREAALSVLQTSAFSSAAFVPKRPAYQNALRSVVAEESPANGPLSSLKARVIEFLALDRDEYVQRCLIEGLEDPKEQIIKPEIAIQLLAYDLHSEYYPILRKIVKNPPNKRSKKEALRNLAADPDSVGLLVKTLKDKDEDKETRHVSAVGLQSLDPEALQKNVKPILVDPNLDPALRVALLNTVTYSPDTKNIDDDAKFQKKLDNIQKNSTSRKLKRVYKAYRQSRS